MVGVMTPAQTVSGPRKTQPVTKTCPVCKREVDVVNYDVLRGSEVGYLGRHWRPGIPRTSKCSGSFGPWVR